MMKGFASDNYAGVSPEIMEAIAKANLAEHQGSYGADEFTGRAVGMIKEIFGAPDAEVFFVMNGTGANVTALQTMCRSYEAVVCTEMAHINTDECAAAEKFIGGKLLYLPSKMGKLNIDQIRPLLGGRGEHQALPRVISITQATEVGTLYTVEEIKAFAEFAHENGLYLHVDGARIANAAVSLGVSFKEMLTDTGVDVVSFGGTKNGMMMGEAVVFLNPELARDYRFVRKQGMQLLSKMRYVGAQFEAYLSDNLWYKNARHANMLAQKLGEKLSKLDGVALMCPVEANGVFVELPREITSTLQERFPFYIWNEETNAARLMVSFDTTEVEVNEFVQMAEELIG
ncbi:low specificity L-threonine aldolase [Limibacter armeniacum]|uniref:threonine aldolase family protein n=1 Tax=Limibacter armeniacum TaxID=466084 RepID=UPI002FE53C34